MQLVNPVRCPEVMVQSVHIVVQDPNSDRKAMRVGRTLVESVDTLERARRAGVELADTVVVCEVVAHCTHRGRPVGEPITRGKEAGLGAPLTHDVERPAAEASRLESKRQLARRERVHRDQPARCLRRGRDRREHWRRDRKRSERKQLTLCVLT